MRSKTEDRITLHITKDLVQGATPQDERSCTLACAGQAAAPTWGAGGNTWALNKWLDGPNNGQLLAAP